MNLSQLKRVRVLSLALHLLTGNPAYAATVPDYAYSPVLRASSLIWDAAKLDRRFNNGRPMGGLYTMSDLGRHTSDLPRTGHTVEELAEELRLAPATVRHWLTVAGVATVGPWPRTLWMRRAMELATFLLPWRERRYADRISKEMLRLYRRVASDCSATARREIYRRVVMIRTGADADEARAILVRAEQSFATWPADRELRFGDVVHYLAVSEYLALGNRTSTRIDMGRVINDEIPKHL
jgi:hypothetical protein